MRARTIAFVAAAASMLGEAVAYADGLSPLEVSRLSDGGLVTRTQEFEQGKRRYVGGVTYAVVDARADDIAAVIDDFGAWRRLLPKTEETRYVGSKEGDAFIEVTHGSALVHVTYTVRVRREGRVVRFWLDASRPHDIEDVWGFFRTDALAGSRQLVTFGILIDMGTGLLRDLFEGRVRQMALTVPDRVRGLLLERKTTAYGNSLVGRENVRY